MMKKITVIILFVLSLWSCSKDEIPDPPINKPVWVEMGVLYRTEIGYSGANWWLTGVVYPRIISLQHSSLGQNNVLLATYEEKNSGLILRPGYPIYRSYDQGKTWQRIAVVEEPRADLISEWMPTLFELPRDFGNMKAGTILLTACSIDPAQKVLSLLRLYKSENGGENWELVGTIAEGGGITDIETGVWEPCLVMLEDGTMACYYADCTERDNHSQKIVYKTSKNGIDWSSSVDVVATSNRTDRPGMPVVTRMGDNGYFMVYEIGSEVDMDGKGAIYSKTSSDGLNWGDTSSIGYPVESVTKAIGAAPYCAWSPIGSPDKGFLIVSGTFMRKGTSTTGTDYFVSYDYGTSFTAVPHVLPYQVNDYVGYSNSMTFSPDGKVMYAVNCVNDPNNPGKNKIVFALVELVEGAASLPENKPTYKP